jgi:poly(3-hydroxybutyrate) depolymerase
VRLAAAALAIVALAGCGGHAATTAAHRSAIVVEGPLGKGSDQYWIFRPRIYPQSVVVFLHGTGNEKETTPAYHRAWLKHLALEGNAVVYPRYETIPGQGDSLRHVLIGAGQGIARLGVRNRPIVVVGYSRGGFLAFAYAAEAYRVHGTPRAILAVFPAGRNPYADRPLRAKRIARDTRIVILVGDRDRVVGARGAQEILRSLALARFPAARVVVQRVNSVGRFQATHLSALEVTQAARIAFWQPADALIAQVVHEPAAP